MRIAAAAAACICAREKSHVIYDGTRRPQSRGSLLKVIAIFPDSRTQWKLSFTLVRGKSADSDATGAPLLRHCRVT